MSSIEANRLKVLEDEDMRLKRILADKELEMQVLRDIVKKTFDYPSDLAATECLFLDDCVKTVNSEGKHYFGYCSSRSGIRVTA